MPEPGSVRLRVPLPIGALVPRQADVVRDARRNRAVTADTVRWPQRDDDVPHLLRGYHNTVALYPLGSGRIRTSVRRLIGDLTVALLIVHVTGRPGLLDLAIISSPRPSPAMAIASSWVCVT